MKFVLPVEDCVLLPIVHTTAEELAQYIATEVEKHLGAHLRSRSCQWLEVKVSERPGQGGNWAMAWFVFLFGLKCWWFCLFEECNTSLFLSLVNFVRLWSWCLPPNSVHWLSYLSRYSIRMMVAWFLWNRTKVASFYLWLVCKFVDLRVLQSPAWCQCPASIP